MHEALSWLLQYYKGIKLWMGVETEEGAEIYLTCSPSQREAVVNCLKIYEEELTIFETVADARPLADAAVGE